MLWQTHMPCGQAEMGSHHTHALDNVISLGSVPPDLLVKPISYSAEPRYALEFPPTICKGFKRLQNAF